MHDYLLLKEFRDIKDVKFAGDNNWIKANMLELSATQYFAKRAMNNKRLLFKLGTGFGKTLTSLEAALPFVRIYNLLNKRLGETYYVHIIGFSKHVFRKEFMKFPELNIITYEEIHELAKLREAVKTVPDYMRAEVVQKIKLMKARINKRITDIGNGGMYNFYGYRELFNDLFTNNVWPSDLATHNIFEYYKSGQVSVNNILLKKFKFGLMIIDEVHVAYNSDFMNNYGLALQFILDYYGRNIYLILLTATIINNNKREIVDICNLMRDPGMPAFKSTDYPMLLDKEGLKKYSTEEWLVMLKEIYAQFAGKVIFLEESGQDYPNLIFKGNNVAGIKYLKFSTAKMSKLHEQTFAADGLYENTSKQFIIHDMVFPNPNNTDEASKTAVGLYDSTSLINTIAKAPASWRKSLGIDVRAFKSYNIVSGPFLRYENLGRYSTKYCMMLDEIGKCLRVNPLAKIIIFHPYVVGSGIGVIGEILRYNGFTPYDGVATPKSYSAEEYLTMADWDKKHKGLNFFPARYVVIDTDMSDGTKEAIFDEWSSLENRHGKYIKILVGAGKIKQSVDFKDTTIMMIMQRPRTMSDYIQIKGRVVRRDSLARIDANDVHLFTFLSVGAAGQTIEERKYRRKINDFDDIRNIEYNINKGAINNYIFADEHGHMKFKSVDVLGSIPFETTISLPKKISAVTYFGHGHYNETIAEMIKWIKRAFISLQVWQYEPLYKFVLNSNLASEDKISRQLFNIALNKMLYKANVYNESNVSNIFNADNIYINAEFMANTVKVVNKKVVVAVGDFYVLTILNDKGVPVLKYDSFLDDIEYGVYKSYTFSIKNYDAMAKINFEQLARTITDMSDNALAKYAIRSLVLWSEDSHYIFMQHYIMGKHKLFPQIVTLYTKLKLMGRDWYEDKINRNIYDGAEWRTEKKQIIRHEEFDYVAILLNSKFKIRSRSENIKVTDRRNNKRGVNCGNIDKAELNKIIKALGIEKIKPRVDSMCNSIFAAFIRHELKTRSGGDNKKYVYLFNE
jgi:superfamily II DNA or RNA helicase